MPEFAERTQRRPDSSSRESSKDRVLPTVTRRDIGSSSEAWRSQFAPRPRTAIPDFAHTKEWQNWATDLSEFKLSEARRLKISGLLRQMIENLPYEVYLPTQAEIFRSKNLVITGTTDAIGTESIRNKLFTSYLAIEKPAELKSYQQQILNWAPDPVIFDYDFVPQLSGSYNQGDPFNLNTSAYTAQERDVLYFLFRDQMIDWARRAVELKESADREAEWRDNVAFGAIAEKHLGVTRFLLENMALSVGAIAITPYVGGFVAPRLAGVAFSELGGASFLTRLGVGATTSGIVGGTTGAVDTGLSNLPELISGELSGEEYLGRLASGTSSGAKWGALFGFGGEILSAGWGKLTSIFRGSNPAPGSVAEALRPSTAAPVPAPAASNRRPTWVQRRAQDLLFKMTEGLSQADILPRFPSGGTPARPVPALVAEQPPARPVISGETPRLPSRPAKPPVRPLPSVTKPSIAARATKPIAASPASLPTSATARVPSVAASSLGSFVLTSKTTFLGTRLRSWARNVYVATATKGYRAKIERLLRRNPDGPLSKALLVNNKIADYDAVTAHLAGPHVFVAGHGGSQHAGYADVILLTSAKRNAEFSRDLERGGGIRLAETAYVIQDIAVERLTAWDLVSAGRLDAKFLTDANLIKLVE